MGVVTTLLKIINTLQGFTAGSIGGVFEYLRMISLS